MDWYNDNVSNPLEKHYSRLDYDYSCARDGFDFLTSRREEQNIRIFGYGRRTANCRINIKGRIGR